jgi:uncharacterized protein involved in exopolysaccharide biosynthesis
MTGLSVNDRPAAPQESDVELIDLLFPLVQHWKLLLVVPVLVGALALAVSFLIKPLFTAKTSFITPQQQGSGGLAAALSALGPLANLAGQGSSFSTTGDMLVALLKSNAVRDRIIERFGLKEVYQAKYQFETREILDRRVRITQGKKDGMVTVEVEDNDPQRAADIANQHVAELQRLTGELSLTEARRRRVFFEAQLKDAKERLTQAQRALEASGFGQGALRAEPKAAAEEYARLKAQITATEVRLQSMRRAMTDAAPEIVQQQAALTALRTQLASMEHAASAEGSSDYVGRYREFKYQETLFELLARQFESAKLDESREDALVQVIDKAQRPEWKSSPKRAIIAAVAALLTLLVLTVWLVAAFLWHRAAATPDRARKLEQLKATLLGK